MLTYGSFALQVIQNVCVIGMMAFLVGRFPATHRVWAGSRHDLTGRIILGLVFGIFSASGNWLSIASNYGFLLNARQIGAEAGGLLGGPLVGALAGVLGAVPCFFPGGGPLWPEVIANVGAGIVGGLIWQRLGSEKPDFRWAAVTGFLGGCILTVSVFFFVRPLASVWQLEKEAALPSLLWNTLAVMFFVCVAASVQQPVSVLNVGGGLRQDELKETSAGEAASTIQDELQLAQKKLAEQQLLLLQTEYRMLRAQINPHFFFNTLSTIQALIASEPERSAVLIKDLANFFRKTLNQDQEFVTVRQELETVRDYVRIEQVRFGDRINLVETFPPEVLDYGIPIFSLQILVENAIRHGLSLKKGRGTVRISGWQDGGSWCLNVEDDGVGMPEERLTEIRQGESVESARGTGIGLFNVQRRIQKLYGSDYSLRIQSQLNRGTSVTMRFPQGSGGEGSRHEET